VSLGKRSLGVTPVLRARLPAGKHRLHLINQELGIEFGETTKDGVFSLESTRCLGTCGLAPVIMVNEQVHGKMRPEQIPVLLNEYMERARRESA
jgi:NADH:ubiquinone oxidoreductase subunit E